MNKSRLIDVYWSNDGIPHLAYIKDEVNATVEYIRLRASDIFSIKVFPQKYCRWYYEHRTYKYVPCPHRKNISDSKQTQCFTCSQSDSNYYLPLSALQPNQVQLLVSEPHWNYLSIFPDDQIKIWVANANRRMTRVLEQWAHASLFFAESDGYVSRQIEEFFSKELWITQQVSWAQKMKGVFYSKTSDELKQLLLWKLERIRKITDSWFDSFLLTEPEYSFNYDKFEVDLSLCPKKMMLISDINDESVISGVIKWIIGNLIILESNSEKYFVLNLRTCVAHEFFYHQYPRDMDIKWQTKEIQSATFSQNLELF